MGACSSWGVAVTLGSSGYSSASVVLRARRARPLLRISSPVPVAKVTSPERALRACASFFASTHTRHRSAESQGTRTRAAYVVSVALRVTAPWLTSSKVHESTGARELECVNLATRAAASARVLALRVTGIVPPVWRVW